MRRLVAVLLLAATSVAQQKPVPETQSFTRPSPKVAAPAPGLHLEISNPAVRVFRIDLPARGAVAIGREVRDYMLVAVSGGSAEIAGFANNYPVDLNSGEVEIFKGGWPHQLRNRSDQPSTWIILEMTRPLQPEHASCGLAGSGCSQFKFGKTDLGEYNESVLFETPSARVLRAELAAASTLPTHDDRRDHVVIPLSAGEFAMNGAGASYKPGETVWVRGAAELRNTGKDAARLVIVEVK